MTVRRNRIHVDAKNRLVITGSFKRTLQFSPGHGKNRAAKISYETDITGSAGNERLKKVVLDGTWTLTDEHDLRLRVSGAGSSFAGKTLILRGEIGHISGTGLAFRVRHCDTISGLRGHTVELKGRWRSDSSNRIVFDVAKSGGRYDTLRLQGAWQLNKYNEVIYRYARTALRTKTRKDVTLVFRGYWEIGKNRLVYRFDKSSGSFFSFKAALQSHSLRAADGAIKYRVGIKYSEGKTYRRVSRDLTIHGVWKLGKKLNVAFEVTYSEGRRRRIRFLVERLFGKDGAVVVSLKDEGGERLGFQVTFFRTFSSDAEFFLSVGRFASDTRRGPRSESRIMGGVRVRFWSKLPKYNFL